MEVILMHQKQIKALIRKQLKKEYPNWKRLSNKQKKALAKQVLHAVVAEYDFQQEISTPPEELLGIEEQVPMEGMMTLEEMQAFVDTFPPAPADALVPSSRSRRYVYDRELRLIDDLLDDRLLNALLANAGYTPSMRTFFPSMFFRAELLKALKYPEISYRKFCEREYMGRERKQNRVFLGLPLPTADLIDHTQLSHFRAELSFVQMVNLLVYVLHIFFDGDVLGDRLIHAIDSTEIANESFRPLASLEIQGHKIRIYPDLDCDCGKRRAKRDKSPYVVGYRMHTLTAIDVETGRSVALMSVLAPANHHDSQLLTLLVTLAQAIGVEISLLTADTAYHDTDGSFFTTTGVHLVTPPTATTTIPEHVDPETAQVFCHDRCEVPMQYVGYADHTHEYHCADEHGVCPQAATCPRARLIPYDTGLFQSIPTGCAQHDQALDIRKHAERPFNLLKHREGLEQARVRSQHSLLARCAIASIATLLIELAGTRRKIPPEAKHSSASPSPTG
jgi:hypothetical protein